MVVKPGNWWVQILSIGKETDSINRMAAGQQSGPRCVPKTFSSLSSLMIDQSTLASLPNASVTPHTFHAFGEC